MWRLSRSAARTKSSGNANLDRFRLPTGSSPPICDDGLLHGHDALQIGNQSVLRCGWNIGECRPLQAADLFYGLVVKPRQGCNFHKRTVATGPDDIAGLGQHDHAFHRLDDRDALRHLRFVAALPNRRNGSPAVRTRRVGQMYELQPGVQRHVALTPVPEFVIDPFRPRLPSGHSVDLFLLAGRIMRDDPAGIAGRSCIASSRRCGRVGLRRTCSSSESAVR